MHTKWHYYIYNYKSLWKISQIFSYLLIIFVSFVKKDVILLVKTTKPKSAIVFSFKKCDILPLFPPHKTQKTNAIELTVALVCWLAFIWIVFNIFPNIGSIYISQGTDLSVPLCRIIIYGRRNAPTLRCVFIDGS